jgi:hypothetical protein
VVLSGGKCRVPQHWVTGGNLGSRDFPVSAGLLSYSTAVSTQTVLRVEEQDHIL